MLLDSPRQSSGLSKGLWRRVRALDCEVHHSLTVRFLTTTQEMETVDEFSPVSKTGSGAGLSALVVDDEIPVRRFVARVLAREAFTVLEAADGVEALDLVKSGKGPVDVVVADIVMPRMNGVELMQALALNYPDLPVILMSGYAAAGLSELGIEPPCGILNKPFPADRLVAEVHRCVSRRNGGSSAA